MKCRTKIAKFFAATARFSLKKILRRPGGFYPGKIALKIDPTIISSLSEQFDSGSILVTGTNGKTSVTALIAQCARLEGFDVCWNSTGANLASGIASAMLEFNQTRRHKNFAVFEIDELWVEKVLSQLKSKYLLLLDLFEDQVDRFGNIGNIQKSLITALNSSKDTILIYNADDPNCQVVADECQNNTIAFGVDDKISTINEKPKIKCPMCEYDLVYKLHQYEQLGIYRCPNCGFNRANPKNPVTDVNLTHNSLEFKIATTSYKSKKAVEYALYNLAGFITVSKAFGFYDQTVQKVIANQKAQTGRMQFFEIGDKQVMINLAKNPAGFNQNINYVVHRTNMQSPNEQVVVAFFVNTKEGDGKDSSWVKKVNFAKLKKQENLIVFYGGQAADMLENTLKNYDIKAAKVESAKEILQKSQAAKNIYIIANYTAMFPLQKELTKLCQ